MRFREQVVVITGASSGIGWELAKQFAREGAKTALLARRTELLQQLQAEIRSAGGIAESWAVDVSNREATLNVMNEIAAKLGSIDVMVANAGLGSTNPPETLNIPDAEKVIRVNLLGVMYSIEGVLPAMLQRGKGQVVAISSLAAYKGMPTAAAYCATKSAVNAYMESLRIQLAPRGVTFTTVCPGFIRTPMTADNKGMIFLMNADRAARKIVRAVYRKKKVYNFPWLTTRLIKFTRWLPDWLLRYFVPEEMGGRTASNTK